MTRRLLAVGRVVRRGHEDRAADQVAQRDGHEILHDHVRPRDLRAAEDAERDEEHVRDRVVETPSQHESSTSRLPREEWRAAISTMAIVSAVNAQ